MSTKTGITMFSGDSLKIKFTVDDADSPPARKDLTAATIIWALAKAQGKLPLVTKTIGSGITVTDAAQGELDVDLLPADTAALKGVHYHELQITDAGGNKHTAAYGDFTIQIDSIQ